MTGEAEPTGNGPKAVVVGAGMIGVCCALFLQRDGYAVTLIDRQGPGEGASYGNGSMLTCEAVVPIQPLNTWARRRLQDLAEGAVDVLAVDEHIDVISG